MHVNSLGQVAARVAFSGECDAWLADLRTYLTANRDFLAGCLRKEFPALRFTLPDATYLDWIDCTRMDLLEASGSPSRFFLEHARVALNDGCEFGTGGEGFVRLNFGCPRPTLVEALDRMKAALPDVPSA